jgi:hypothetical protein
MMGKMIPTKKASTPKKTMGGKAVAKKCKKCGKTNCKC